MIIDADKSIEDMKSLKFGMDYHSDFVNGEFETLETLEDYQVRDDIMKKDWKDLREQIGENEASRKGDYKTQEPIRWVGNKWSDKKLINENAHLNTKQIALLILDLEAKSLKYEPSKRMRGKESNYIAKICKINARTLRKEIYDHKKNDKKNLKK